MFHYIYDVKLTLTYQMTQQACLQTEFLNTQQGWNGYRACQVLTTHQCWNEPGHIKKRQIPRISHHVRISLFRKHVEFALLLNGSRHSEVSQGLKVRS